ncbi:hypothetical protein ACFWGD_11280 [Corynebacterium sp. NPDC060344]|uniref:hypothetical protein n=1 Tax=Corynebacterium sp. NPDC060344 TaxID=3347101 RepID=UPI0036595C14
MYPILTSARRRPTMKIAAATVGIGAALAMGAGTAGAAPLPAGSIGSLSPAAPSAPADEVPTEDYRVGELEYSADGETWSTDQSVVGGYSGGLIPGGAGMSRSFHVRNADTEAGTFLIGTKDVTTSEYALFVYRVDLGDQQGTERIFWGDGWDTAEDTQGVVKGAYGPEIESNTILESIRLEPGESVVVSESMKLPDEGGNLTQNQRVNPGLYSELRIPPATPGEECQPSGAGSIGSIGSGSLGSLGSLGSVGSIGSLADNCADDSDASDAAGSSGSSETSPTEDDAPDVQEFRTYLH